MNMRSPVIDELVARAQQRIFLDLGHNSLGAPGWTVMDDRQEVDVRHDPFELPWPLEDESVYYIRAFHVVEHLPTACIHHRSDPMLELFNEMWRVLCPGGTAWITCPHAETRAAWADPTNRRVFTEEDFSLTRREYREEHSLSLPLECDFTVGHGFVQDFTGDIVEMHISLVKGGPSWQHRVPVQPPLG